MSDEQFEELGRQLGQAFSQQADRFEPSRDAYTKVATAVADAQRPSRALNWLRPMAAVAAVAGVVAVGGIVISAQGSQSVNTGPADDEVAATTIGSEGDGFESGPEVTEPETSADTVEEDPIATTTVPEETDEEAPVDPAVPAVTGPVAATPVEAGEAFLALLRKPFATVEELNGSVVVRSHLEGGEASPTGRIAAELTIAEVPGGFAVTEATSEDVIIDNAETAIGLDGVTILGSGTGFEATLDVTLMSALDNRVIAETFVTAGNFGEAAPYTVDVPVAGSEHLWAVVSSSEGADGVTESFAARTISHQATTVDPTGYSVVRIGPEDADGGLVVRSGPGTANDRVGVILSGTGGVRRTSELPVAIGRAVWWSVSAPGGLTGWVHSQFLAVSQPVSERSLEGVANAVQNIAAGGSDVQLQSLPFTRRAPVLIGTIGAPIETSAERLFLTEAWRETQVIPLPEVYGEPREASLFEHMWVEAWPAAELQPGGQYSYAGDQELAETYFAGLASIVIAPDNPNSPWDRTFLFMETTPTGPEIIGMVVEVQQP